MEAKPKNFKHVKTFAILILVIVGGGVLVVKFATGAAAQFTDNVLRPLLGNTAVGVMEKTYFNTTDKIQQLTDKNGIGNGSGNNAVVDLRWRDGRGRVPRTRRPESHI